MKKRFTILLAATVIMAVTVITILLTGCGALKTYSDAEDITQTTHKSYAEGYFTIIKEWRGMCEYKIVYANDTRVMYLICSANNLFDITPLFNPDGTLQVYGEGE